MSRRTERRPPRVGSLLAALAAAGVWATLAAGVVAGHSIVLSTEPADGSIHEDPPTEVRLVFSEPLSLALTTIDLVSGGGQAVAIAGLSRDAHDPHVLVVQLPALARDTYRLAWRSVSDEDLHATAGSIVFGYGVIPGAEGAATTGETRPADGPLRSIQTVALVVLLGAAAMRLLARPGTGAAVAPGSFRSSGTSGSPAALRRLAGLAAAAAGLLLAAEIGRLILSAVELGPLDTTLPHVAATAFGQRLVGGAGLAALAGLLAISAARSNGHDGSRASFAMVVVAIALAALHAASGHLATAVGLPAGAGLVIAALHLVAAAIWTGGVVALAVVVLPAFRAGPDGRAFARRTATAFGALALGSLAVLATTGLLAAGRLIASPDALIRSDYGHLLILKSVLVVGACALGAMNARRFHRGLRRGLERAVASAVALRRVPGRARLVPRAILADRRIVAIEAAGLLAVTIAGAGLASAAPALGPAWDAAAVAPDHASGRVADLVVSVDIRPNRPGRNFVSLGVFDTRRPAPAPVESVLLRFEPVTSAGRAGAVDGGLELPAVAVGDDRYEAVVDLPARVEDWQVGLTISRPGLPVASLSVPWVVPPAGVPSAGDRAVLVSDAPLAPLTDGLAAAVVVLGLGTLAAARLRAAQRSVGRPDASVRLAALAAHHAEPGR